MEIWKDVKGYEGLYQVSNKGEVRRIFIGTGKHKTRIVKGQISQHGYHRVQLTKEGNTKIFQTHRLVASAFVTNPEGKELVNHIDGNKQNNCSENLEWCTRKENQLHAYKLGLQKVKVDKASKKAWEVNKKKIEQYDMSGNYMKTYDSIIEASKELNISKDGISNNLRGRSKSSGGYVWKYKEDIE